MRWRDVGGGGQAGLGVVDLLLTIAILSIITAIAVPSFDATEQQVDRAARALVADALEAQSLAVATGVPLGLRFEVESNRYSFVLDSGVTPQAGVAALQGNPDLSNVEVRRLLEARSSGEPVEGAVLTAADFGGAADLVFGVDGIPQIDGSVDLRAGAARLRVRVQAATGRVTITVP
ncbi:MAG: hypothetical protein AAF628_33155 [Planctomycetota bacterium]